MRSGEPELVEIGVDSSLSFYSVPSHHHQQPFPCDHLRIHIPTTPTLLHQHGGGGDVSLLPLEGMLPGARVSDFVGHELEREGLRFCPFVNGPDVYQDGQRPLKADGTVGYIDPEYYSLNVLTAKSDVYGLGVVLLELLTGKREIFKNGGEGSAPTSVVDYAVPALIAGELTKVLDKRVPPPDVNEGEAVELMAYTAMHCVNLEGI